jgi:HAD superfamily hydrolase (TIGR01490 family)
MKKFAFFDVDYTLYDGYTAIDFQQYLLDTGFCDASFNGKQEEIFKKYKAGEITYTQGARAAIELQAETLKGKGVDEVAKQCENFIEAGHKIYPFAEELFSYLKKEGFTIVLISGSCIQIIEVIAKLLGADLCFASELNIIDNAYSGTVKRMMNDEEKSIQLQSVLKDHSDIFSLGFGDTTGDIFMLSEVDTAFVVNPHQEEMQKTAKEKGWEIVTAETILEAVKRALL